MKTSAIIASILIVWTLFGWIMVLTHEFNFPSNRKQFLFISLILGPFGTCMVIIVHAVVFVQKKFSFSLRPRDIVNFYNNLK